MDLEAFFKLHRIGLSDFEEAIFPKLDLNDSDLVFVSGSLCEGLGNDRSDIDLFVVSLPNNVHTDKVRSASIKGIPVDIEYYTIDNIEGLLCNLDRVLDLAEVDWRRALQFSISDEDFLHRLAIGMPIRHQTFFDSWVHRLEGGKLSRLLFYRALADLPTLQSDIVGLLSDDDYQSVFFRCQEYLGLCIDALLASLGNTNPARKWRLRKLARYSQDGFVPHLVSCEGKGILDWYYEMNHRVVESIDEAGAFASDSIRFSNEIIPWSQNQIAPKLVIGTPAPLAVATSCDALSNAAPACDMILPRMSLDAVLRLSTSLDQFELFVLRSGEVFIVNQLAYHLLVQFDGKRTVSDAIRYLTHFTHAPEDEIARSIRKWIEFLDLANLFHDSERLRAQLALRNLLSNICEASPQT